MFEAVLLVLAILGVINAPIALANGRPKTALLLLVPLVAGMIMEISS